MIKIFGLPLVLLFSPSRRQLRVLSTQTKLRTNAVTMWSNYNPWETACTLFSKVLIDKSRSVLESTLLVLVIATCFSRILVGSKISSNSEPWCSWSLCFTLTWWYSRSNIKHQPAFPSLSLLISFYLQTICPSPGTETQSPSHVAREHLPSKASALPQPRCALSWRLSWLACFGWDPTHSRVIFNSAL